MLNSKEIRDAFLDFFKSKDHHFLPSSPMVVKDDPTLMFTNAGMNQFKDIFLGNKSAEYTRVANSQKCLRVSGKHNDLEEVGVDGYHHTFFEMLGNWSFGDYFKEEAIAWAWELLTNVYKIPKDRIYVTVFGGDKEDQLAYDTEAQDIWKKYIDDIRIIPASKKDNFWEMGDVGPCGPCSEIHIDIRSDDKRQAIDGLTLVNRDHPQVIEIWNLVFIQFLRLSDGALKQLPNRHVDTGMGFERLCMVLQAQQNNYETDVFTPIIAKIQDLSGKSIDTQQPNADKDPHCIATRVIADHLRAISFAIADGLMPSNNKAGYVIRRILRRAVRYAFTFLDVKKPLIYQLVPTLAHQFKTVFPELYQQQAFIMNIIEQEEIVFLRTLERGLKKLDEVMVDPQNNQTIKGEYAFELYDTYGFPLDLTMLIANEEGFRVDEKGFEAAMDMQKNRSRVNAEVASRDWITVNEGDFIGFIGYDQYNNTTKVLKYRVSEKTEEKNKKDKKQVIEVILEETPFYAESGGQVGDTGTLVFGDEKIKVLNTKKENDSFIHVIHKLPAQIDADVNTYINTKRRTAICANHSATHLLHAALKQVLGNHVEQKGSLVNDEELRFDFNHFEKITNEQLDEINTIVNAKIFENIPLDEKRNVPIEQAKGMGAMALFGEKYGAFVRVITFDDHFSVELCGGTHVKNTSQIGTFQIISEGSIAAGVRRISAVSGEQALKYFQQLNNTFREIKGLLSFPKDTVQTINVLLEDKKKLQKRLEGLLQQQQQQIYNDLKQKVIKKNDVNLLIEQVDVEEADTVKNIAFSLSQSFDNMVVVICANVQSKPNITILIDKTLVQTKHLNAGELVRAWAKHVKGGGGGQPFFAVAGGSDVNGLQKVIAEAKKWSEETF